MKNTIKNTQKPCTIPSASKRSFMTVEENQNLIDNLKSGDLIEFYTCCNADRKLLKGTVEHKGQLGWMKLEDGTKCMPYIKGHSDENMYRVNNCPSCGKYVRNVMI